MLSVNVVFHHRDWEGTRPNDFSEVAGGKAPTQSSPGMKLFRKLAMEKSVPVVSRKSTYRKVINASQNCISQ